MGKCARNMGSVGSLGLLGGAGITIFKVHTPECTDELTNAPDDEELTLSFGIQNGAAAAKTLSVDYVGAYKERTAVTEL